MTGSSFARWEADDVLEALHRAGLSVHDVAPAHWSEDAPQPRTHRQAVTFGDPDVTDPHLLLLFETREAMEAWRLWLSRYVKARPYVAVKDNLLLLVSRDIPPERAAVYHAALDRLGR